MAGLAVTAPAVTLVDAPAVIPVAMLRQHVPLAVAQSGGRCPRRFERDRVGLRKRRQQRGYQLLQYV